MTTLETVNFAVLNVLSAAEAARDAVLAYSGSTPPVLPDPPTTTPDPTEFRDFLTVAAAKAATISGATAVIRTAGHTVPGKGGGMYLRVSSEPPHGGKFYASGAWWELAELEANLYQFGATGQASVNQNVAITEWLSYGKHTRAALKVPTGYFMGTGTFVIDFVFHVTGNGIFVLQDFDGPMFNIILPAGGLEQCVWKGAGATGAWSNGVIGQNSAMLRLDGLVGDLFQFAKIGDFHAERLAFVFRNTSAPRQTDHGLEGSANWCKFRDITVKHVNKIIAHETGSGTGNEYNGNGGLIGYSASIEGVGYSFGGAGCVVGDILIQGGHFGAIHGSGCILEICPSTVYRSRILLNGAQADAGMTRVLSFAGGGVQYDRIDVNVVMGGGVTMGSYPALANSRLWPPG